MTVLLLIITTVCIFTNKIKKNGKVYKTTFFLLDFFDSLKQAIHGLSIDSIVKLEKIKVIEDTKIEKSWRENPPCSGDRYEKS